MSPAANLCIRARSEICSWRLNEIVQQQTKDGESRLERPQPACGSRQLHFISTGLMLPKGVAMQPDMRRQTRESRTLI